ncbi:Homeobox-leucine zipper protein 4 / HD-ZIP protein [Hibiscus syriacus]|uniref:Homeobox-leucine zipper protein 4 / HD-ZIP protein n=1 Tax=Hibiscus syriacus TaxID=106335 RepID=A0A6A3B818_HIBSY|nr:uncharacterized protein LOC120114225 [Hibiscus syriacus]KAE8712956.1 Homeobox-leucine zipper protein 4 / HD-ZIP protein [Hibiscus syriacus]
MADVNSNTKHQLPVKEQNQANPCKYYTPFLYKALLVLIFSVVIQVFPSQAPEFINQTLLNRNWELLHLLFVGIAVSYVLFSRRTDETEKENYNNQSKFENVQSLISRTLQVSSVFDEEAENLSGSDDIKVQTWGSLYKRNEPHVIVAKEHCVVDENTSSSPGNPEKPFLLPVRSLKSRALNETSRENRPNSCPLSRSNSKLSSKRYEWSENNNVVLPSPIPWRSRSGRMEMKEDGSFRSQSMRLSRSNSMSASPKLPHSPPLFSPKSSLSPPPPLMTQKPTSLKPVSSSTRNEVSFEKVMVETTTDDDSESEDDGAGIVSSIDRSPNKEEANPSSGNDGGSDVDKKAEEFIAKVREQIRLQRIDSIKRSSGQFNRNST